MSEYEAAVAIEPPTSAGWLNIGAVSQSWFLFQHITNYKQYATQRACSYKWKDPRPAAMAGINELMFRTGIYVANTYNTTYLLSQLDPGLSAHYNTTGSNATPATAFGFAPVFFFAAASIEMVTIVLVASTFFGFWRLGRHVSFSPLEFAKVSSQVATCIPIDLLFPGFRRSFVGDVALRPEWREGRGHRGKYACPIRR